jgi:hypothetical protein
MDQNTKKFCGILDKLGDQFIEIVDFYNEAEEIAEIVLESNYEDTCYHTNITINDDFTATVNQERKDNLTEKDFPPDDYYPMGIDGLSESKSWNLSKYEVSLQLTEIILPRFEEFLVKIKDGFDSLQKLKLGNSTSTEALGMIKNLHNVGILFVTGFKKYGLPQKFVDNLKMYFSEYCDLYLVCGRLDEFKVRMGIEQVKQKKDKPSIVKDKFSFPLGQVLYEGKDLKIPTGEALDVLKKLVDKFDSVVPYQDLEPSSVNSATDVLRGIVQKINQQFILHEIPCFISSKRTFGYILSAPKIPHFKKL